MNRREFLAAAGAAPLALRSAAELSAEEDRPERWAKPRHFIWTQPDKKAMLPALKEKYGALRKRGLHGVFLYGLDERELETIRSAGLEAHVWIQTTNRGDKWIRENHPDWYMVSRSGKSCFDKPPYIASYRWVSPVIPGVQRYLAEEVDKIASQPAVSGLHLDYVRYPDVILPKGLWSRYGLVQNEELPDYDFCYSEHTRAAFRKECGRDLMEIADPAHDQEWLHFRHDSVSRLVDILAKAARNHKKQITAAVFPTPRLARKICRQDWGGWPLDFAAPMLYHGYYEEPVEWVGDCVLEDVQAARFPIVAGLYMPDMKTADEFRRGLEAAKKNGASGICLFGSVGEEFWKQFEDFAGGWS
ncbi:MAG: Tat pathway signal protein [Fimbriimonadales bacterium]